MLQVLGRTTSINVRKVLWTCAEIGLAIDHVEWGLAGRPLSSPEFLALNPHALVPVIVDDGFVLRESNTICRYLAAKHGRVDLLPAEAAGRARVEQWMDWQATDLNGAWGYAFLGLVRQSAQHRDAAAIEASARRWNAQMAMLDGALRDGRPYVAGEAFTLADIVLGLSTHRWLATPIERPALPAVARHIEALRARPAFRAIADPHPP